ncbi:MAG: Flp pilus assembly complex ATPase component TadA [Proteobacteria bacterium]|nr:Flp pilus assembly complex ATPase component TadA [Pseudomonadota bacterium]
MDQESRPSKVPAPADKPVEHRSAPMPTAESIRRRAQPMSAGASSASQIRRAAEQAPDRAQANVDDSENGAQVPIVFEGTLLTAIGGVIKIPQESRNLCALFDTGLWLVSSSHRNSPLVTSVAATARRMGFPVGNARLVTPDVIRSAYNYFERQISSLRLDENSVRRQIVRTLAAAADAGANDVHIEASGGRTRIEFRIDGTLRLWETWTQKEGEQLLSSVYSHSSGQSGATANWLEPQAAMLTPGTGADTVSLPEGIIAVRCQWVPLTDGGRYLNMRLQYDSSRIFGEGFTQSDVDQLGFNPEQTEIVRFLRRVPSGMRIFAGPVNQGKTTTLRVMLNRHMAETGMEQKCYMIEDPPEGGVIGASQIGVSATVKDDQRERSFSEIMRCILRLDPNIVMLGETRDLQTVRFIFRLALTGRQVYTTLHVYSALAIPQRLRDLGAEPYMVYDHHLICGMICQRLLRGLCPHCRIPVKNVADDPAYTPVIRRVRTGLAVMNAHRSLPREGADPFDDLREPDLSNLYFMNSEGCRHCYKGRQGRTIVAEVVATDGRLMELLAENKLEEATQYWLSPFGLNGITMGWHALEKIRDGNVSAIDAEAEVGPCALPKDVRKVEERLGRRDKWVL